MGKNQKCFDQTAVGAVALKWDRRPMSASTSLSLRARLHSAAAAAPRNEQSGRIPKKLGYRLRGVGQASHGDLASSRTSPSTTFASSGRCAGVASPDSPCGNRQGEAFAPSISFTFTTAERRIPWVEKSGHGDWTDSLVGEAAGGSQAAKAQLSERLLPRVRAMVIARLVPSPAQQHDIDDLTQDCLVAILDGVTGLREPKAAVLRAYASTIVSRKTADYIRKAAADANRRNGPGSDGAADSRVWATILADSLSPRSSAARRDEIRQLVLALSDLKESYRRIVTLAFIDQISMKEIAEQLEISRPAASMLLMRAIRTLRRQMTGEVDDRNDDSASSANA